jgi:hippurate hydrolase
MNIPDEIASYHDEMTAIRRDIHAHPEIGFEEVRTSEIVAKKLAEYGIEVHRGIGKTGVVGVLRAGNGQGSIGLRADMDALPILEENSFAHKSTKPGTMHACGHDGHTTMLLGAARYLARTKRFDGTVYFIFQPAEEGLGGAAAMLADGLFEKFPCETVFGMHNSPGEPTGKAAIRSGASMAGGGFFDIKVQGRGSHGARPELSVDPVMVACHIATALQTIVSRNVSPKEPTVVSVTAIRSGEAYNVIPQTAIMRGTVRTFSKEVLKLVEDNMRRMVISIAAGFGAKAELDFRIPFLPLVNDATEAKIYADAAAEIVGEDNVERNKPSVMASEDFSYMLDARPGAYINIGNGDTGPTSVPVHNPAYEFNDAILPIGAAVYARLVERKLSRLDAS